MNFNIGRFLRWLRTKNTKSKHSPNPPGPSALAIPEQLLPVLRRAADDELERACDNGGEWNDEIRVRVLQAARAAEAFDLQALPPAELAGLADRALGLPFEDPIPAPADMEDIADFVALFSQSRELIALRDAAKTQAERGSWA
jgi:hypothetical protein